MTILSFISGDSASIVRLLWLFLTLFLTRGIFLFALVYCLSRLLPWLPPGVRHSLWFAVICSFLLLPGLRVLVPVVHVPNEVASSPVSYSRLLIAPLAYRETLESALVSNGPFANGGPSVSGSSFLSLAAALTYVCGLLILMLRMLAARVALRRMTATGWRPADLGLVLHELTRRIALRRSVSVSLHSRVVVPFTFGVFTPRIMLPESSVCWPRDRLKAVLAHELAHVKRRDSLMNLLAQLACAFIWFIPPVWIARTFMLREAEMSCDRSVLDQGYRKSEYALAILELGSSARGGLFGTPSFLARKNMIKERLLNILLPRSHRQPDARARLRRTCVAAFCLPLVVFALTCSLRETDKLLGTWVNKGSSGPWRYVWMDSGSSQEFARRYASNDAGIGPRLSGWLKDQPCSTGRFVIDKEWSDWHGNTWYQVRTKWTSADAPRFALIRLDSSGSSYESDESLAGYPLAFSGALGTEMHQLYFKE